MIQKKIFSTTNVRIPLFVLVGLLLAAVVSGYHYYTGQLSDKSTTVLGGFLTGLILVIIQFLFDYAEYSATSRVQELGVKDVLINRDNKEFYRKLISKANRRIDVMGVTAVRFMEDFADSRSGNPETSVLLEALSRGAAVRILVPKEEYLKDERDRQKAAGAAKLFYEVGKAYPSFQCRYFAHPPAHSIVVIDDECLIGPVLPNVASRHTPAIYIESKSEFVRRYLDYFESEWDQTSVKN